MLAYKTMWQDQQLLLVILETCRVLGRVVR